MRKNLKKGTQGYIHKYKKKIGLISLFWVLWITALFLAGIIITKTKMNVMTVFAILFVLPAARTWTNLILMLPYHSCDEARYQCIAGLLKGKTAKVYADLVLTKYEGVMYLPLVVSFNDNFYVYAPPQKRPAAEIRGYLNQILKSSGVTSKAMVSDDFTKFETAVKRLSQGPDLTGKKQKTMEEQLFSAAV